MFGHLGRAAEVGDEVAEEQLRFRVLETSGSRIQRLEIEFLPAPGRTTRRKPPDRRETCDALTRRTLARVVAADRVS